MYRQREQYQRALELTDVMLTLNPKCLIGLVHKGAISAWLGYNLEAELARLGRSPTAAEEKQIESCRSNSETYIEKAKVLGWQPETPESQERYLKVIDAAKKQQ